MYTIGYNSGTSPYSILKYGLSTLKISEAVRIKMQHFTSMCLRGIVEAGGNPSNWEKERETNEAIRRRYGVPPLETEIYEGKIFDIPTGGGS